MRDDAILRCFSGPDLHGACAVMSAALACRCDLSISSRVGCPGFFFEKIEALSADFSYEILLHLIVILY
jgi:hypothetical protein